MKVQKTITNHNNSRDRHHGEENVTGKVWFINPPSTVILTMEDGKNQEFKIPNGQKFNVDGQMVDAWGLKKGMTVNATKVVEAPTVVVATKVQIDRRNAATTSASLTECSNLGCRRSGCSDSKSLRRRQRLCCLQDRKRAAS